MKNMNKRKRYTQGQEQLLRLSTKDLNEMEQEELRKLLAPRSKYLPQTDTERFALVQSMLKDKYQTFLEFIERLKVEFSCINMEWILGDKRNILYYKAVQNSKTFCSIGVRLDVLEGVVVLDERLCKFFEEHRASFSRMGTQWLFDITPFQKGKKILYFDLSEKLLEEEFLQLLLLKKTVK